jgi:hypothetical protein
MNFTVGLKKGKNMNMNVRVQHSDVLKQVAMVWETAPQWGFCQVVNYIHHFRKASVMNDEEISEVCDAIVAEMDAQRPGSYIKPILIQRLKPNKDTYLEAVKDVLVSKEYDAVLSAIIDVDEYDKLDAGLKAVVDAYFDFQT